jgi:hypothetical protein
MSEYKEEYSIENGVLYVRLSGTFPKALLHDDKNLFQPLIDACKSHNIRKALVDARDLHINFGTMAVFRAGEDAAILSQIGLCVALLTKESDIDPFFDTVTTNRGGYVGIFTDMDAATAWLEG